LELQRNRTHTKRRHSMTSQIPKLITPTCFKAMLLCGIVTVLSGCGFNLRGTAETLPATFPSLNVKCEQKSAWRLCHYLNSRITSAGTLIDPNATVILSVARAEVLERVFSLNSDATAAERELTHSIHYRLFDKTSGETLSERSISRSQIYQHNASALVAKDREKEELQNNLDESLIDIMLREISILSRD
jgi:LPS-assembly lipoprotein